MTVDIQELDYQNNTLYRDHYRVALGATILMALFSVCLSLVFILMMVTERNPKYYATTTTGLIIPLYSLSEPVVTKNYMLQWASLATRAAYNLDFTAYQTELDAASQYFTPDGFSKFKDALTKAGLLTAIQSKKLIMNAIVAGDPVILDEYVQSGRRNWIVQLPLLITFTSASETEHMHLVVTLRIQRVPTLDSVNGIQISDFSAGYKQ